MPEFWPFVLLFLSSIAGSVLALVEFHHATKEWEPRDEAREGLRLIHGQGAEVREFGRRGA